MVKWVPNQFAIACSQQDNTRIYELPHINDVEYKKSPIVTTLYITHRQRHLPKRIQNLILNTLKENPDYFIKLSLWKGNHCEKIAPIRKPLGRPPGSRNKRKNC